MSVARLLAKRREEARDRAALGSGGLPTGGAPSAPAQDGPLLKRGRSASLSSSESALGAQGVQDATCNPLVAGAANAAGHQMIIEGVAAHPKNNVGGAVVRPSIGQGDERYFWISLIRTSLAHRFDNLAQRMQQPIQLDEPCAGMGAAMWVMDALQGSI